MRTKFIFIVSLLLASAAIHAQSHHEFLATVVNNPFSYARVDSIPGIMWLQDNAAYDANSKRFFLQGTGSAQTLPNDLVVLNALTGAVIVQSPLGANLGPGYHIACLQYDNSSDTLYCIIYSGSIFQFGWIEELNGTVHVKSTISGVNGYAAGISAMDENHHRVFIEGSGSNGIELITIDAPTGTVVSHTPTSISPAVYLEYNNATNHLYAISVPGRLDSIDPATGTQFPIATIIQMGLYQSGIWAINETLGHFIFSGSANGNDSLYTVDLQTGVVVSRYAYAYANAANPAVENVIFYCMDQQTQILYALNWGIDSTKTHPTGLDDPEMDSAPTLFPVPSDGHITMQLQENAIYDLMNVYDAQGRKCFVLQTGNSPRIETDLSFLPDGVYTLELSSSDGEPAYRKLIIQH